MTLQDKTALIKVVCLKQNSRNPVEIAKSIMTLPEISMHGPEHHIIDGSALLTAVHNTGAEFDLPAALDELAIRGAKMPGATCGQWGVCGSVSSVGAALAIINGTGPLSNDEHYRNNLHFTSLALGKMAEIGGPRCCKRNAFISLATASEFIKEKYGFELETGKIRCEFSHRNEQCLKQSCPFFVAGKDNA